MGRLAIHGINNHTPGTCSLGETCVGYGLGFHSGRLAPLGFPSGRKTTKHELTTDLGAQLIFNSLNPGFLMGGAQGLAFFLQGSDNLNAFFRFWRSQLRCYKALAYHGEGRQINTPGKPRRDLPKLNLSCLHFYIWKNDRCVLNIGERQTWSKACIDFLDLWDISDPDLNLSYSWFS